MHFLITVLYTFFSLPPYLPYKGRCGGISFPSFPSPSNKKEILVSNFIKSGPRPVGKQPFCKTQKILFQNEDVRPSRLTGWRKVPKRKGTAYWAEKKPQHLQGSPKAKISSLGISGFSLWCCIVGDEYSPLILLSHYLAVLAPVLFTGDNSVQNHILPLLLHILPREVSQDFLYYIGQVCFHYYHWNFMCARWQYLPECLRNRLLLLGFSAWQQFWFAYL